MTDYLAIVLNGLFTGIGVILAHEIYDAYKKYRKRIGDEFLGEKKQNEEDEYPQNPL
jgi:hypothetical protein